MALTMLDKAAGELGQVGMAGRRSPPSSSGRSKNPNPCVGNELVSESERVRVWMIRLQPGERIGFHRHVLDYFWTSVTGGRGRQHVHDGTTVEYTYAPGETRHETYGAGEFKVHDLENLGDKDMVFMTIEFLQSANKPMPLPARCGGRTRHSSIDRARLEPVMVTKHDRDHVVILSAEEYAFLRQAARKAAPDRKPDGCRAGNRRKCGCAVRPAEALSARIGGGGRDNERQTA